MVFLKHDNSLSSMNFSHASFGYHIVDAPFHLYSQSMDRKIGQKIGWLALLVVLRN